MNVLTRSPRLLRSIAVLAAVVVHVAVLGLLGNVASAHGEALRRAELQAYGAPHEAHGSARSHHGGRLIDLTPAEVRTLGGIGDDVFDVPAPVVAWNLATWFVVVEEGTPRAGPAPRIVPRSGRAPPTGDHRAAPSGAAHQ